MTIKLGDTVRFDHKGETLTGEVTQEHASHNNERCTVIVDHEREGMHPIRNGYYPLRDEVTVL